MTPLSPIQGSFRPKIVKEYGQLAARACHRCVLLTPGYGVGLPLDTAATCTLVVPVTHTEVDTSCQLRWQLI